MSNGTKAGFWGVDCSGMMAGERMTVVHKDALVSGFTCETA